jgi:hypothetical protein
VDRAHRDWTPAQIGFIANLVRLYRGEALDLTVGDDETAAKLTEVFGDKSPAYADVPGLCKAATLAEIEAQGWSLNPGRYVGVAPGEDVSDEDFKEQLETLNEELESLNAQAREPLCTCPRSNAPNWRTGCCSVSKSRTRKRSRRHGTPRRFVAQRKLTAGRPIPFRPKTPVPLLKPCCDEPSLPPGCSRRASG